MAVDSLTQGQLRRLESQAGGAVATANAAQAQQQTQMQPQQQTQMQPQQQAAPQIQPQQQQQQQLPQPPPVQQIQPQHAQGMVDPFAQYAGHLQEMVGTPGPFGLPAWTPGVNGPRSNAPTLPVPSSLRDQCADVIMSDLFVDSMASMMILSFMPPGARVTNASPSFSITQVNGHVPVTAVVDVGIYIEVLHSTGRRAWKRFDTRGVLIAPDSGVNLYSTRVFRDQHGARHSFESPLAIYLANGTVPMRDDGSAFVIRVGFGSPALLGNSATLTYGMPSSQAVVPAANGPSRTASTSQELLWQRLGFPNEKAWRYVMQMTANHGQPDNAVLSTTLAARESVMRGRARALPFLRISPEDRTLPPPGAVWYMDSAGPLIPSVNHRFIQVSGIIDAGSGYSRGYPAHRITKEMARSTYERFASDIAHLLGVSHPVKPHLIISDQGSMYVAHYFREFLSANHVAQRFSTPYTPQQNPFIERVWGSTFSSARVLLAAAGLPPTFWTFAFQTARWILNRMPQPSRGNMSPFFILTRRLADIAFLRAFGCLCRALIPAPRRQGDRHLADRGVAAIYLGPSEESSASVVMSLSDKSVFTTRDLVCYEDRFPGIAGQHYDWFALDEGGVQADSIDDVSNATQHQPSAPALPPAQSPPSPESATLAPSPGFSPLPRASPLGPAPPPSSPPPSATLPVTTPPRGVPLQEGGPARFSPLPAFPDVTSNDVTGHPQVDDPSSRHYDRRAAQPQLQRVRKQTRLHNVAAHYVGRTYASPLHASPPSAAFNFALLCSCLAVGPVPAFSYALEATADVSAYASTGDGIALKAMVRSTSDLGELVVPKNYRAAIVSDHANYWRAAIAVEMSGLIGLRTWDIILLSEMPPDANLMGCHFVFEVKRNHLGELEKFKARLVADGNSQQYGVDFDKVFSTVVRLSTVRLVLAIAAARDYNLHSVDIRQAFLQGQLTEDIYMRVPPGHPSRDAHGRPVVLKLNKSLYGLKQAGRVWNKLLVKSLLAWGFKQSTIDICLFTLAVAHSIIWLLVWVDDIIIVDNDDQLRGRFTSWLQTQFPVDDRGELVWVIGIAVKRDRKRRTLALSQELYVSDVLKRWSHLMTHSRSYSSPMDDKVKLSSDMCPTPGTPEHALMESKRHDYMAIVGALLWLSNVTYFHLAFASSQLARYVANPGDEHFTAAIRVLVYVRDHPWTLRFDAKIDAGCPLTIYVDSDWSVKFSSSGALFFFGRCLIGWFSKVQRSVSFSSAESEIFGAILAAKEGIYLRELLHDLGLTPDGPTRIFSDSKSCIDLSFDPVSFKKTKHILRAAEGLRDYVARFLFLLTFVAGKSNVADILTKAQAVAVFNELMREFESMTAT